VTEIHSDNQPDLDFDQWARLAEHDPASFESARRDAIEALIESFPAENRERMRRLQWRIDQERRLARSPMGSCIRLSRMMWRQLLGEGGLRERLLGLADSLNGDAEPQRASESGARVLAFSRCTD